MRRELTNDEKQQILRLHDEHPDWPQSKLAEIVGKNQSTISRFLRGANGGKRTGRPKVTSLRDDRAIVKEAKLGKKSCAEVKNDLHLECSVSTIYRRLRSDPNTKFGKHKGKPALSQAHKAKRLAFAKEMVSLSADEWSQIIWSDEKKWNLDGPDGLRCFWYDLRKEKEIFSKRQGGGGSVMIWAGFAAGGRTEIAFVKPKSNSNDYQDILAEYLLPVGPLITDGNYIFMQDNAPIHRSFSTKSFLEANEVRTLDWPPLSPDLNPIENLWGWLSRKIYAHGKQYSSISELKCAILNSWNEIPDELIKNLVNSMKNRMIKVIELKGGSIDY